MTSVPEVLAALTILGRATLTNSQTVNGPLTGVTRGRLFQVGDDDFEVETEFDSLGGVSTTEHYVVPCSVTADLQTPDQSVADTQAWADYEAMQTAIAADPSLGLSGFSLQAAVVGTETFRRRADEQRHSMVRFGVDVFAANVPATVAVATVDGLPSTGLWSAHRGGGAAEVIRGAPAAPDNTLAAYEYALSVGASILDVDCYPTLDNIYVCMHDNTVDRTTAGTGAVSSFNYAALPQVDMREIVGNGWAPEPIPTIAQVLDQFGERAVLTIEAKNGTTGVGVVGNMILDRGLQDSVLMNCDIANIATVGAAITAVGCRLHVYSLTTVADVQTADAAGAFLIELPYNCSPSVIAAAVAATNIQRWITAPIQRRTELDAATVGFHGYVSNAPGYLGTTTGRTDIGTEILRQKVGAGWRYDDPPTASQPAMSTAGIQTGWQTANDERSVQLGSLSDPKPTSYSVYFTLNWGAYVGDTASRTSIRVCCPSDEGRNFDSDTRGYSIRLRKTGVLELLTAPVGYGTQTTLATVASTAIPDAGQANVSLRFDVTPTWIRLVRVDTGTIIGPIFNTDWRGDYVWVGGPVFGAANHDMTFSQVSISS